MPRVSTFRGVLALVAALALSSGVSWVTAQPPPGQFPPGGPGGPMGGMMRPPGGGPQGSVQILLAPVVQKELKLTDEQKTKVYNLSQTAGRKARDAFQAAFLSGPGGNPQASQGTFQKLRQENERAIATILDSTQAERFQQISLQSEGPLAVVRPEIAAKLGLNRAQNEAIQGVVQQMQQSVRESFMAMRQGQFGGGGPGGDPMTQMRQMGERIRAEGVQQVGKILDRKQKVAFNKMLGEPFDIKALEAEQAAQPADGPMPPPQEETKAAGDPSPPATEPTTPPTRAGRKKATRPRPGTPSADTPK